MNLTKLIKITGAIAAAAATLHHESGGLISFDDAIKAITEAAKPVLPVKPDGTAFTDLEIHEAAKAARAPWERVLTKLGAAPVSQ